MISSSKPAKIRIRLIPALWTTTCVVSVISLSLFLYVAQLNKNEQLAEALIEQVTQLLGDLK